MTAFRAPAASGAETVPSAFRAIVETHPDRRALEAGASSMTYAELDRLSNRIAHGLLSRGGEEPVAMVAPLEPMSIVVMFGALKAGRTFVPLDPRDPPERLALLLERLAALQVSPETPDDLFHDREDDPGLELDPFHPAFVYFTSGSTGRSKGTVWSHKQVALASITFEIRPDDRFASILPLAFAGSQVPVFGPLLSGATACLFDPVTRGPSALATWVSEANVTVLECVPSVFRTLATLLDESGQSARSLRLVIVGGEPCRGQDLVVARRLLPETTMSTHLGSSEAGSIAASMIEPGEPLELGPIPFDRFYPWNAVSVVDESRRPVPVGTEGEILVRGTGTSLGYWGEAAETELRFVSEGEGVRSVRTAGDRGRFLPDGRLEHLGRVDLRVKVRGQMVDPQEIEDVLRLLPTVREAVVSPVTGDGGIRLVAHIAPQGLEPPTARELRRALAEKLPSFMIPSTFLTVESIPRNQRGKIDREALREAAARAAPVRPEYTPPRTERERALCDLVAEVLGVEHVGVHDDVFDLGLDSLSWIELVVAIDELYGANLAPEDISAASTVEALAQWVDAGKDSGERTVFPLRVGGAGLPFFCAPGGGGRGLNLLTLARRIDRPTYSFTARGLAGRAWPDRTVERAAARYVRALRSIQPAGPYLIGGYSFGGLVAFEMASQLRSAGESVALLVLLDSASQEPTYRGRVSRIAAGRPGDPAGRIAVARRLARRAAVWVRHGIESATAGIVARPPDRQLGIFLFLSIRMGRRYRPRPYDGPALVLRTDHWQGLDHIDLGGGFLVGEKQLIEIPGDHVTMLREPYVATVAAGLRDALAAADPTTDRSSRVE